jgi:hypothetical protein
MKSKRNKSSAKSQQGILIDVARTIGTTLGTLAAKTGGVSEPPARVARGRKRRGTAARKTRARRSS